MIHFACEHCRRPVRVADVYGGKQGRCPHCKEVVSIPPGGGALEALAAALEPDGTAVGEDSSSGTVPPPPPIGERPLDEDFILPEDDEEDLEDTVILPAEEFTRPEEKRPRRHHHRPVQSRPGINAKRTFLIVAAAIVVLIAALIGFLAISRMP